MLYVLNNSTMCKYTKEKELIITVPGMDIMTVCEGQEILCDFFEVFLTPRTYEEGFEAINLKHYLNRVHYSEYFDFCRKNNILKEVSDSVHDVELSQYHVKKYDRQINSFGSLPGVEIEDALSIQKKICNSCVCVIGIGGTGSHLALTLASIGVEKLIVVDYDRVELSNTSRQVLYTEQDVGKYKVDIAKERLKQYNSHLDIITHNIQIRSERDLEFLDKQNVDLLILCADTPRGEIQYFIDKATQERKIPWFLYGPYQPSQIMVGPYIIPGVTRSYSELFPPVFAEEDESINKINSNYVAAICDPYNGFASQFASIEALKILSGARESALINRRYYIDTDTWNLETVDYD